MQNVLLQVYRTMTAESRRGHSYTASQETLNIQVHCPYK